MARDRYQRSSEEEKNKKKECARNKYHNMAKEEKNKRMLEKLIRAMSQGEWEESLENFLENLKHSEG